MPLWHCISICCLNDTVTWQIPDNATSGTYRIVHTEDYGPAYGLSAVMPFRAETLPFEVRVAQR